MSPTASRDEDVVMITDLAGITPFIRGKVRDVYDLGSDLLIVATDRISAYDCILPNGIPDKGKVLSQLSAFWFRRNADFCPSHFVSTGHQDVCRALGSSADDPALTRLSGRSMLVRKTQAFPVECVVRGYLDGSAWKEYRTSGSVCGIDLPAGLSQGSRLPKPIFTPATKSHAGHDENITHAQMATLVEARHMGPLIELSLSVYRAAAEYARAGGVIIADTKFEFGVLNDEVVMIDECLTPDSSRFWDVEKYRPGSAQESFDKQYVRDFLDTSGWDHEPPAPPLPPEVVEGTSARYRELFTRVTGTALDQPLS